MDNSIPQTLSNATAKPRRDLSDSDNNSKDAHDPVSKQRKRVKLVFGSGSDTIPKSQAETSSLDKSTDLIRPILPLSYFASDPCSNIRPSLPWPSILEPTTSTIDQKIPFPSWIMTHGSNGTASAPTWHPGSVFYPTHSPSSTPALATHEHTPLLSGRQMTPDKPNNSITTAIIIDDDETDDVDATCLPTSKPSKDLPTKQRQENIVITIDDNNSDGDEGIVTTNNENDKEAHVIDNHSDGNNNEVAADEIMENDLNDSNGSSKEHDTTDDDSMDSRTDDITLAAPTRDLAIDTTTPVPVKQHVDGTNSMTNNENSYQREDIPIPTTKSTDTMTKSTAIGTNGLDVGQDNTDDDVAGSSTSSATVSKTGTAAATETTGSTSPAPEPARISSPSPARTNAETSSIAISKKTNITKAKSGHNEVDMRPPPAPRQLVPTSPILTPSINNDDKSPENSASVDPPTTGDTNGIHDQQVGDNENPKIAINALTRDKEPIYIHPHFVKLLKSHQIAGIQFMWNQIMGEANGCVLAHCMGLGKTFQVVVLVATLFQEIENGNVTIPGDTLSNKILIIAPLITLANWLNEFDKWLPPDIMSNISHIFNSAELIGVGDDRRVGYIRKWYNEGGVMLMSYDTFRSLLTISVRRTDYEEMLLKPSVVILDEAHRIKDRKAAVTQCVNKIQTPRRICLTGYPLQNNLSEYYCMIDFIYPGLLGDEQYFKQNFQKPVESIYADSSHSDRYLGKARLLELQLLTENIIQRKDATILNQELPGKTEYYISCKLTSMQYKIYLKFLEMCKTCNASILLALMLFRCLCNHPSIFKEMLLRNSKNHVVKGVATLSDDGAEVNDQDEYATVNKFAKKELRNWKNYDDNETSDIQQWNLSHKINMILSISRTCKRRKEKLVIVSHSIASLDYIQDMLSVNGHDISRIDGQTPREERQPIIDEFNEDEFSEVMLLSAKAGGIGVNITGANRMILVDSDWNPSHDEQSVGRVYRFGQKKHVIIYRLLAYSTVESILLKQAAHKHGISRRVVDNKLGKLQMEKELRQYYRPPEKDPPTKNLLKSQSKISDPVLKEALQQLPSSVVELNTGGIASHGNRGAFGTVELDTATTRNILRTVGKALKDAKRQHKKIFSDHM